MYPHVFFFSQAALQHGVIAGRKGFGSVFVVASGNGGQYNDNCNYDGYANSIYTITVGEHMFWISKWSCSQDVETSLLFDSWLQEGSAWNPCSKATFGWLQGFHKEIWLLNLFLSWIPDNFSWSLQNIQV